MTTFAQTQWPKKVAPKRVGFPDMLIYSKSAQMPLKCIVVYHQYNCRPLLELKICNSNFLLTLDVFSISALPSRQIAKGASDSPLQVLFFTLQRKHAESLSGNSSVSVAELAASQFVPWWATRTANGVGHNRRLHQREETSEYEGEPRNKCEIIREQRTLPDLSSAKNNRGLAWKRGKWEGDKSLCKSENLPGIHLPQLRPWVFHAEWEKTMHEHSNYFAIRFIRDFWKPLWRCACIAEDKLQHWPSTKSVKLFPLCLMSGELVERFEWLVISGSLLDASMINLPGGDLWNGVLAAGNDLWGNSLTKIPRQRKNNNHDWR